MFAVYAQVMGEGGPKLKISVSDPASLMIEPRPGLAPLEGGVAIEILRRLRSPFSFQIQRSVIGQSTQSLARARVGVGQNGT